MNNLHRELASITPQAWAPDRGGSPPHLPAQRGGGRRVVDVTGLDGPTLASVGTGHLTRIEAPGPGVTGLLRQAQPLIELRVPFKVGRDAVDDVERGSNDSDWQPVKDAARAMAFTEDGAVFDEYEAAAIDGLRRRTSHPVHGLSAETRDGPDAVSRASANSGPCRGSISGPSRH